MLARYNGSSIGARVEVVCEGASLRMHREPSEIVLVVCVCAYECSVIVNVSVSARVSVSASALERGAEMTYLLRGIESESSRERESQKQ